MSAPEKKIGRGTAKRVLSLAAPYSGWLILLLLVVVVNAAVWSTTPLIYRRIINDGILKGNAPLVTKLSLVIGAIGIVDVALGVIRARVSAKIGTSIVFSIRTALFEHIQQMPLAFFTRTQTGALMSRVNNDAGGVRTAFTGILANVTANLITVVTTLGALFFLSPVAALAALVLLPLFVFPTRLLGRRLESITRDMLDQSAALNSLMIERFNVSGALLVKLFGLFQAESQLFRAKSMDVSKLVIKQTMYSSYFGAALLLMATFANTLAYWWAGVLAAKHVFDVGTVVAIVSYLARIQGPFRVLSNTQVNVTTALVSFERVFEILDHPPMIRETQHAREIPRGPAKISFERVAFRYPSAREVSLASLEPIGAREEGVRRTVLNDVSFTVEPGKLVALVGPSGGGKTTITHLVPRLYDVQSGSIKISGIDVRDVTFDSLRQRIGVVTQNAHLFHDTVRANLLYAKPGATETQIRDVLRSAQILSLIESLPEGLDTLVGERGYRFSGGEKQRLAIARMLLKGPDIVILDEATAHLDSESEAAVQRALESALAGRTSIVIAHRLSTILKADQILVVQDGCITERGAHAELLEMEGIYSELYRIQFSDLTHLSAK